MTTRQKLFSHAYIFTAGNGAEAARQAGYSSKGAKVTAANLLQNNDVKGEIAARFAKHESDRVAAERELLEFLTACVRGEVYETITCQNGKTVVAPIRCSQRIDAAEMLLKIYGTFKKYEEPQNSGADLFVETLRRIQEHVDNEDARKSAGNEGVDLSAS